MAAPGIKSFSVLKLLVTFSLLSSSLGNIFDVHAAGLEHPRENSASALNVLAQQEPHVLSVTPESGSLKERNTAVKVTFDTAMDQPRTEAAFTIQPDVPHRFQWEDAKSLQIDFSKPLDPGTQYALTLAGGTAENSAKSIDGIPLPEDYRWYYWLDPFDISVTTANPKQVILKFSSVIDREKSGLPFRVEPELEGEWKWESDQTAYFDAASPFLPAQKYTVTLTGPLHDQFGEIPYVGSELAFTAPPPIRSVEPKDDTRVAADFGPIQIVFSEPVDQQSAQNAFAITPAMSGRFSWSQSPGAAFQDTLSFLPDTLFERGKQYIFSLAPSLKSRAGSPLMLSSHSWTFSVEPYSSTSTATFGEYGSNVQVVDANGPRKVQFGAGDGLISFELYRYDLIDFVKLYSQEAGWSYGLPPISLPDAEEERLAATWYYTQSELNTTDETVIPPDVPPGLYILNLKRDGRSYSQLFVVLTWNTIVAKISGDQLFIWVSDINGENIPEAEVRLYSDRGEKIREGKTDERGLYRVTLPSGYTPLLVSAKVLKDKETDVALTGLTSEWTSSGSWSRDRGKAERYLIYTYTDRPIYRPGQTMNFKSILRDDQDVRYSLLPAGTPITINIRDPKNNLVQSTQAELSQFGSVNGSFPIAEGATLGNYIVEVLANGEGSRQVFKVEDYRKPDFKVTLTPSESAQTNQVIAGESIDLDVDVRYFFDEPVAGAGLIFTYYQLFPSYYGWDSDPGNASYNWMQTSSQERVITQRTGADGKAHFTIKTDWTSDEYDYSYVDDWRSSLKTRTFAVEVSADDGSNQPVSATYIYKVTNADQKLSLDTLGYFKSPNAPFTVQASVRDLLDKPVAGRKMTLRINKWNNKSSDYDLFGKDYPLTSAADGNAKQELILETGYYQLILTGEDSKGNSVSYTHWMSVFASGADWYDRINSEIKISAEKEMYKPYETARFMIESGFSGPALLTFERGSVIHTKEVMLTAPLTIVEAQIIPEDAPNIFVTINAWEPTRRQQGEEAGYYYSNIPDSHLRIARTELLIESDAKSLKVSIETDQSTYAPGDPITVTIGVKDKNDRPVAAEVSLALVDEAIFSLSDELSPNIFKAFYGPRPLSVETYDSMTPYREIMVGGRGGGGGEGGVAEPRHDFPDTAAWYPVLITDANGRATITFNLPDNLTSWRLSAKAITLNHLVGEARTNIETRKELMLRPFLPRVLTTGDQAELAVMVHNYSNQERSVQVTLKGQELQIQNEQTQSVRVPAGGSAPVGWRIIPTGTTETQITFTAVSENDQASDSIQLPLPIHPLAVADVQSVSGSFTGSVTLNLPLPADVLADNSLVTLRLSRSPASSLLDGLEYLTGYPYGCVEQTMSRAMPNAVLGRASAQLGLGGVEFRLQLDPLITASLQKLYAYQHYDGGWGWWFDDASDDYQTAWVLQGLAVIQSGGYTVEPQVIEKAVKYLNEHLADMDVRTRAYALYSMALAGKGNLDGTRSLASTSLLELDPFSQAALALASKQLGDEVGAAAIVDMLENSVRHKGNLAYWPQSQADGEYHRKTMASTIRTTAFVLSAILKVDGASSPLVKPVADYLISGRTGNGWGTTNETSFTILALTEYLSLQQAEAGASDFEVILNGSTFSSGTLESGKMFSSMELPLSKLNSANNQLELSNTGAAPLYYDLITRYTLSRKTVEAAGNISVTRQYLDPKTRKPLEQITAGQLVMIRLTVEMPDVGAFMLVEDHLPGGLEALNEELNTTSRVSLYYDEYYENTEYRWQDYGYNNKEIHGDRVTFFITQMDSGTKILSYLARATTPGTFIAIPAESYAMYDPLLWGRSSDTVLIIKSQK